MDALDAIFTRRSTRKFQEQLPERVLIEKVIEAGRFAPSGGNSQTTHFLVITDAEILKELPGDWHLVRHSPHKRTCPHVRRCWF